MFSLFSRLLISRTFINTTPKIGVFTPKKEKKRICLTVFPALERATQMAEDSWTSDPSKTPQPDRTTATWSDILDLKNLEHLKENIIINN